MSTVGAVLKRMVTKGFHGPTSDESVTVTIDKLVGLGSSDVTYLGCAKQVVGPPGRPPFPCRKRVGKGDFNPNEVLNHKYSHSGPCSVPSSGLPFYAMAAMISDHTGFATAQLFAPARHVLGMPPAAFVKLPESRKAEVLLLAVLGKTFRLQLMTCWTREDGKILKVLFVDQISPVPRTSTGPKDDPDVYDLASSMGSLCVSAVDSGGEASEVQSASPRPDADEEDGILTMSQAHVQAVLDEIKNTMQKLLRRQEKIQAELVDISKFVDGVKENLGLK